MPRRRNARQRRGNAKQLIHWDSRQFFLEASPTHLWVTWKLREFSTTPAVPGDVVESEVFSFQDAVYSLRCYPQGCTEDSAGVLYLCLEQHSDEGDEGDVMFKLFYRDRSGGAYLPREGEFDGIAPMATIKREKLTGDLKELLLTDDTLVVCCELRDPYATEPEAATADVDGSESFSSDYRQLLADIAAVYEETPFPDVTIKVGGKQFPAHKAILSMRSSVFRGMFEADMQENRERLAELREMEEQTFRQMLQYIYTGNVGDLDVESAKSLYVAADQYDLPGLKERCRRYLRMNISVDNICEMALMADLHSDEKLKAGIKVFLCKNHQRVLKSETWRRSAAQKPTFFWELIGSVLQEVAGASRSSH